MYYTALMVVLNGPRIASKSPCWKDISLWERKKDISQFYESVFEAECSQKNLSGGDNGISYNVS